MAEERVIKIGMLGLGTVGTGVYKVLKSQQEEMLPKLGARVELKKTGHELHSCLPGCRKECCNGK